MNQNTKQIARAITLLATTATGFAAIITNSTVAIANTQSNPAITVSESQRFVIYTMPENGYANLQSETQNDTDIRDVTRSVLRAVPDEYDFVMIVGKPMYNRSKEFGSSGQLQGVIHLPARSGIQGGPSLHEFTHRWANDYLPSSNGGHWDSRAYMDSLAVSMVVH